MNAPTQKDVATGWIATQENWWAWEAVDKACREDPELGWGLVLAILSLTDSHQVIENLGAGPLEDLLAKHGDGLIERAEKLATQDPEFRRCLSHTWQNEMSQAIWDRVCRATDRDSSNVHGRRRAT